MSAVSLSTGAKMFYYVSSRFGMDVFPAIWPTLLSLKSITLKEVDALLTVWAAQEVENLPTKRWSQTRMKWGELFGAGETTSSGAYWHFAVSESGDALRKPLSFQLWSPRRKEDNWQPYPNLDIESEGDGSFSFGGWIAKQSKRTSTGSDDYGRQLRESWLFGLRRSHDALMQLEVEVRSAIKAGLKSASELVVALSEDISEFLETADSENGFSGLELVARNYL